MTTKPLKSGWKVWRFDQMAHNVNVRIDDPSKSGAEFYVGLDHLDSDSLKIRRWGSPDEVEATKLCFKKGDIIFGRRRAYQRKLGVAEFDGICSAHAMVLRAKPEVVLPEFLPFFMQSDLFMKRAVEISVGSLSPTINWKTMAIQEFVLPPLEEQRKYCALLGRIEACLDEFQEGISASERLVKSLFFGFISNGWAELSVGDVVLETQYGLSLNAGDSGKYPMLRMMNLVDGRCVENDLAFIDLDAPLFEAYKLKQGDVLFNRTNSYELVGRTGVYDLDGEHVFASYLVRLKADLTKIAPEYLAFFLNSDVGRRQVLSYATKAVSQANVNANNLLKVRIPIPSLEAQKDFFQRIDRIKAVIHSQSRRKSRLVGMKAYLLNGKQG